MSRRYPAFDRSRLHLLPLAERTHDLRVDCIRPVETPDSVHAVFGHVADSLARARQCGAARIFMMGAHVIRSGVQRYLFELMEAGAIDLIAMNGAGVIHDFEFALIGATTESVAHYISAGQFGLWQETGRINEIVTQGAQQGLGLGEAVGRALHQEEYPCKDASILAKAWSLNIPVTVHVGIGHDIIHEHPNFDPAACGQASYRDFLRYVTAVEHLEQGVVLNFGSAVMAPEIYLKALAMARNAARSQDRRITQITTLVCDLQNLPTGEVGPEPDKGDPRYYFRPWKTMLSRTVSEGGKGYYYQGHHAETIPQLWAACMRTPAFRSP